MSSSLTSAPAVVTVPPSPKPGDLPSKSASGNGDVSSSSSSSSSGPFLPVLRVSQLDAYALDNELLDVVFLKQLQKCVDIFNEQMSAVQRRDDVILGSVVWYHTIRVDAPTPGMEMMNVTFVDNKGIAPFGTLRPRQKWTLLACGSMCKYVYSKATNFVANKCLPDDKRSITVKALGTVHSVARTMNLILFLYSGKFPNVPQRVANVRFAHENPNAGRAMTFEYLNRALAMREIGEVGKTVVIPLVESRGVRELFRRAKYVLGFRQQGETGREN